MACACLAVNIAHQEQLAEQGWSRVDNNTRMEVQEVFSCCGFDETVDKTIQPPTCEIINAKCCINPNEKNCVCPPCMKKLQDTINYAFKLCGWIGVFFSLTEVRNEST